MAYIPQSTQPKSWEELKELMGYLSDCDPREARLAEDTQFYDLYRELVPKKNALEIIHRQIGKKKIALIKNNFPYSRTLQYLPEVKQYCLWSLEGVIPEDKITEIVTKSFPHHKWCKSERKINYKSVPEIWHCHIFVDNSSLLIF